MQLTTNQILTLYRALTELRGRPTPVLGQDGRPGVVFEPYEISDKFGWNAAKNRNILRRYAEAHDELIADKQVKLNKDRRALPAAMPAAERQVKLADMKEEVESEMRALGRVEQEVEGLLLMPATGLNLKLTHIPPTVIDDLMLLIDGEPVFEEKQDRARQA